MIEKIREVWNRVSRGIANRVNIKRGELCIAIYESYQFQEVWN